MRGSQRALIIEDRPEWQQLFASVLESIGWQPSITDRYQDALHLLDETDYGLVIIDPAFDSAPHPDGFQLLLDLHERYPRLPLIVVSGSLTLVALRDTAELPSNLAFVEKQKWDREAFKGVVLQATIDPADSVGRKTLVHMLREALLEKPTAPLMPAAPAEEDRQAMPRVLIVENQPEWQAILAQTLEEESWFWRSVPDAAQALRLIKDVGMMFHIILLDYHVHDAAYQQEIRPLLDYLHSERRTRLVVVCDEENRGAVITRFAGYPLLGLATKTDFKKNELLELIYAFTLRPHLRFTTLGMFQVVRDGEPVDDFGSASAETLLKILLSQRGEPISAWELREFLFPEQPNADEAAVHGVVDRLRLALQPDLTAPQNSAFIVQEAAGYVLDTSQNVDLDFERVEQLLSQGKAYQGAGDPENAIQVYEQASRLYGGEYLPADRHASWSVALRNHMQTQIARVLNRLADLYAKQGAFDRAIRTAQICLRHDSYHESTHRRLMRYHTCNGNREAALTVYRTLEKLFGEFFGDTPSPETIALRDAIAAGASVNCLEQPES